MRKFYLLCTAMLLMCATSVKADRILFSENYEAGGIPSTWTYAADASKNGGATIAGDSEGHYFSFYLGSQNGRSANCLWGDVFGEEKSAITEYSVHVEFQFQAFGNDSKKGQHNGSFAIFSDETCALTNGAKGKTYGPYWTLSNNCLFDLSQNSVDAASNPGASDTDITHWFINNDTTNAITPVAGAWYELNLTINTQTREVSWSLADFDNTLSKQGSFTMAEDANVYATGLYIMNARYQSVTNVDNIKVTIPGDYANDPVIALTGVNNEERTYTISFMEGETLHLTTTDGSQKTIGYYDGEIPGQYVVTTTTSGTISAYTTAGTIQSNTVSQEVDCSPITLPSPTYNIVSAEEGYSKTYQFTVDNSGVEMQPQIFMDFSFKSEDGSNDFTLMNQNNGVLVEVKSKGVLTVTTKALGYSNGTATIMNDIEYVVKHDIDFQTLTAEKLAQLGFEKMDDLNTATTSGESNWTGRRRFYYDILTGEMNEDGTPASTRYYVYGPSGDVEGAVEGCEPIQRYRFVQSKLDQTAAYNLFAPLYTWWREAGNSGLSQADFDAAGTTNLKMYLGIGLVHSGVLGDDESYDPAGVGYGNIRLNNTTLGVDGLTDNELIVVSKIDNYGGGSVHPVFEAGKDPAAAREEYKAMHLGAINSTFKGTETFQLNRVDTSLSRVLVLTPGASGIDEIFTSDQKTISDHNAPIYNLNGVQVNAKNLKSGIYVKQGKKFIVR